MLKITVSYSNDSEKDKLIKNLKNDFRIVNIPKEYPGKGKSPYKKTYIDLSNK